MSETNVSAKSDEPKVRYLGVNSTLRSEGSRISGAASWSCIHVTQHG